MDDYNRGGHSKYSMIVNLIAKCEKETVYNSEYSKASQMVKDF